MNVLGTSPNGAVRQACLLALGITACWPAPAAAPPSSTSEGRARPDLASFRLITERNIFNTSRVGGRAEEARETRRPARVDAFGLVGVMSYDKGTFAFFDGSGADYRKALQKGGAIAGFELLEVLPSAVKLQNATNQSSVEMRLGMQMRREEEGEWKLGERTESFDSAGSSRSAGPGSVRRLDGSPRESGSSPTAPARTSSGGDADALQRLLKKREAESK